ncbi:MAG: ABC transporter ATP-binding protein [Pseudomarimonas sp.]
MPMFDASSARESTAAAATVTEVSSGQSPPLLHLEGVFCSIADHAVVRGVSLQLAAGELGCLLGPSGCGKTTLLRTIAGFQPLTAGNIFLRGELASSTANQIPPERRRLGFVFQDLALFPHLRVEQNIGFGLQSLDRALRAERVNTMLAMFGLQELGQRYPHELSGGQQQRVALARSMAPQPDLLLLDEPFSSLDAHLRSSLRDDLVGVLRKLGIAALLVTHDQAEAFCFADRLGVMREGELQQWDSAFDVYHRPASAFVARFVGEGKLIGGRVRSDGRVDTALGVLRGTLPTDSVEGSAVSVLVRPDDLLPDGDSGVPVRVVNAAFRGAETLFTLALADGSEVCALFPSHIRHHVGEQIRVTTDLAHVVIFPEG